MPAMHRDIFRLQLANNRHLIENTLNLFQQRLLHLNLVQSLLILKHIFTQRSSIFSYKTHLNTFFLEVIVFSLRIAILSFTLGTDRFSATPTRKRVVYPLLSDYTYKTGPQ